MAPPALAYTFCSESDLQEYLGIDGVTARVDDEATGAETLTGTSYINAAISWGTTRCNFYLQGRYDSIDLANSWLVNQWAVICACYWLSCRRGNPAPGSVDALYKEAIEDMKLVKQGEYQIPDIGLRESAWPAWTNVRVDTLYALRKVRVERPISEPTSTHVPYRQNVDWGANFILEP